MEDDMLKVFLVCFMYSDHSKAPRETEAELAYLNSIGIINAVLSDDVDNFLFGAKMVDHSQMHTGLPTRANHHSYPSRSSTSVTFPRNSKHSMKNADGRADSNHSTVYTLDNILTHPSIQLT
jgi:Holliday junction resolvase YEN1